MKPTNCTILRTFERSTWNSLADACADKPADKVAIVTERCGTPLFSGDPEGVCRTCAKGWEVEKNKFFNATERARAMQAGKDFGVIPLTNPSPEGEDGGDEGESGSDEPPARSRGRL